MLRECLKVGRYSLQDESEILKARWESRARLQWIRNSSDSMQCAGIDVLVLLDPLAGPFCLAFILSVDRTIHWRAFFYVSLSLVVLLWWQQLQHGCREEHDFTGWRSVNVLHFEVAVALNFVHQPGKLHLWESYQRSGADIGHCGTF